jgi:ATP-binding cassette, subfamily B, multidrug efflux pump
LESFKRIIGLIKPYLARFIVGMVLTFIFVVTYITMPYVSKYLVDVVIKGGKTQYLIVVLILLVSLALCRSAVIYVRVITNERVSQNVVFDLRQTLYEHLHSLPYRFYDNHRIGEIMSRLTGDMDSVRMLLANGIPVILEHSIFLLGSIIAVFTLDYRLALIILTLTPFIVWLTWKFDKTARPQQTQIREQNAVLNTITQENISGVRVVKAYAREDYEIDAFAVQNRKHLDMGITITRTNADFSSMLDFVGALPSALLILVGGYLAARNLISPGTLIAAIGYVWMIMMPLRNIPNTINMVTQAISSGDRLFYYADFGSDIKEKPDAVFPKEFKGAVKFDNVTFKYEDEAVLRHISFDVKPGHTLAIMGATGSGKTTIVNLLGRFYECSEGAVMVDGIDVKDYKLKELRSRIGYVMQETFLFSETLENNIAFGRPEATEEELDCAAEAACASEYVTKLDDGYNTIVGERGMGLSGGQKQRAAIARALCYNPAILVFDDATSAVDMETEFEIQKALKQETTRRTTFIISHRISAVKDADEIIVLENGTIAERGVHFELLKKRGLYYNIFMDQYRDYEAVSGERLVVG